SWYGRTLKTATSQDGQISHLLHCNSQMSLTVLPREHTALSFREKLLRRLTLPRCVTLSRMATPTTSGSTYVQPRQMRLRAGCGRWELVIGRSISTSIKMGAWDS